MPPPPQPARPTPPPKLVPSQPERYKVSFTAGAELRDKLERLQELMEEDLAAVVEAAVTEKLERLEAKRYGTAKRPPKEYRRMRYVAIIALNPAPVRRVPEEYPDSGGDETGARFRREQRHPEN